MGDIIAVKFGLLDMFEHYAVYIGHGRVIHFAPSESSLEPSIHEADFEEFLGDKKEYYIMKFPEEHGEPKKNRVDIANNAACLQLFKFFEDHGYQLYSPKETVKRAKSRLGESDYNLALKNCEHFAIWCKTGIEESYQVKKFLKIINLISILVRHA